MAGQRGATFESVIWKKRRLLNGWGEQGGAEWGETTAREPVPLEARARCRVGYFVKSTFGACAAAGVCSSKYSRGPFPISLAVSTCGNRRM